MKEKALTIGFAALAVLATAGWVRQPEAPKPASEALMTSFQAPAAAYSDVAAAPATVAPVTKAVHVASAPAKPVLVAQNRRYRNDEPRYSQRTYSRNDDYYSREADRRAYPDEYPNETRSAGKSAVIIGGGAATGAAIGAMTGGGKGAAIGAVVGGAGGLIYDRLTRKKNSGYGWEDERGYQYNRYRR
jgi:hypothetical protein